MPKLLLHLEGFVVLLACLFFYQLGEFNWLMFILLLFVPDLSALGYLINVRTGALLYNIVHTYTFSLTLILLGFLFVHVILLPLGLIFTAHIGLDRLCGFGLKYPTTFKDTHLNRL